MDTIHLDHIGPMDLTTKKYKYILSVIDGFSKFVWLYPTKTLTAAEVIKKMQEQEQHIGIPNRIITDRGTAFTSMEFESYCNNENNVHVLCTIGIPRCNGQVVRLNRIIKNVLTKMTINDPDKW